MVPHKATRVLFIIVLMSFFLIFGLRLFGFSFDDSLHYAESNTARPLWSWLDKYKGRTRERLLRSEMIYQKTISGRKAMLQEYPDPKNKPLFPSDSFRVYFVTPFSIWDFVPAAFNCPGTMERIGRLGDGGKWVCGLEALSEPIIKSQPCIIYSFGVQNESSFEEEVLERTPTCQIWGYDFSVDRFGPQLKTAETEGRAYFTKAMIGGVSSPEKNPPVYNIQDLMAKNGHSHIDIVKMDIEGFEFETLNSLISFFDLRADSSVTKKAEIPVSQLLIEIHLMPGMIDTDGFLRWWERLEQAGFRPVWTEPNLLVTTLGFHDRMPRYAEYTFINVKDSQNKFVAIA